jgi:hypothetical protein
MARRQRTSQAVIPLLRVKLYQASDDVLAGMADRPR